MGEIIQFIYSYKGQLSFLKLCSWCHKNKKTKELQAYQNIIIEMVKEHNREKNSFFS